MFTFSNNMNFVPIRIILEDKKTFPLYFSNNKFQINFIILKNLN